MGFIFNEVFWGILLIIFGAGIVINVVFKVNLPIWRLIFAFILIYTGVRLMMGESLWREESREKPEITVIFQESNINVKPGGEYTVIFGKGNFDFMEIAPVKGVTNVKINMLFGAGTLKLNSNLPYKMTSTAVFAGVEMPDGSESWFGEHKYQSKNFQEDQPYLTIKADVIFGGLEIVENKLTKKYSGTDPLNKPAF